MKDDKKLAEYLTENNPTSMLDVVHTEGDMTYVSHFELSDYDGAFRYTKKLLKDGRTVVIRRP